MIIIGIDPGVSGAISIMENKKVIEMMLIFTFNKSVDHKYCISIKNCLTMLVQNLNLTPYHTFVTNIITNVYNQKIILDPIVIYRFFVQ